MKFNVVCSLFFFFQWVQATPSDVVLEQPADGSIQSGVGIVRGWVCDAYKVEVSIDSQPVTEVAYKNKRLDTRTVCGDTDNGFELLINWSELPPGRHSFNLWVDDGLATSIGFTVSRLDTEVHYLRGLSKNRRIFNFPSTDKYVDLMWSTSDQNFKVFHSNLMAVSSETEPPIGVMADGTVDTVTEYIRNTHQLPALAGFIDTSKAVTETTAVGTRQINQNTSVTNNDRWHLASLTKSMTSAVAARLVADDVISWDTTLLDVFPELTTVMKEQYQQISLRELLSHTAGIPYEIEEIAHYHNDSRSLETQRLELLTTTVSISRPGQRGIYHYSNLGYAMAATMLEKVSAQSWESMINSHLFEPLKLRAVGFDAPPTLATSEQPVGHDWDGQWVSIDPAVAVISDNPAVMRPSGGVHMSMLDTAKYLQAHLKLLTGDDVNGWLTASAAAAMYRSYSDGNYGLGWAVQPGVISHNGSNGLWYASMVLLAEEKLALFAVSNAGSTSNEAVNPGRTGVSELIDKLFVRYLSGLSQPIRYLSHDVSVDAQ